MYKSVSKNFTILINKLLFLQKTKLKKLNQIKLFQNFFYILKEIKNSE